MAKRILIIVLAGAVTWATIHFVRKRQSLAQLSNAAAASVDPNAWLNAVEKVKAVRDETSPDGLIIPPELKHYSERYWFLATQVAEIDKYNVHTCEDFLDLAGVIQRGEMVTVPTVTDTYVLFGIGQRADDSEFTRFVEESEPDKEPPPVDQQHNLKR